MAETSEPRVAMVNVSARYAVLESGETFSLTNLFDEFGEETTEGAEAVSVVGQMPDGRWIAIHLDAMQPAKVN